MSLVRTTRRRNLLRLAALIVVTALLYLALDFSEQRRFEQHLEHLQDAVLPDYLAAAFPSRLFARPGGSEPDTIAIRRRINAFNEHHLHQAQKDGMELPVEIIQAGPVLAESQFQVPKTLLTVSLNVQGEEIPFTLASPKPSPVNGLHVIAISIFFLLGLIMLRLLPQPASINAYPLARDMAIIFDRKVSANQTWGAYRLTHLGGGGQIEGIPDNDYTACNNERLRMECFQGLQETYHRLRPRLLTAIQEPQLKKRFKEAMDSGFCMAIDRLGKRAPDVFSDYFVTESFRPFVRDEVLGFALVSFHDKSILAGLAGLPEDRVTIEPPPLWLIGGYEIYYPRSLLLELIEEVRSGLVSAYGQSFDHIHVFAQPDSAFIHLDFSITGAEISADDAKRLDQYLAKPFAGGLSRTEALLRGFGRLMILDTKDGFDISGVKRTRERSSEGLINRVSFRKIRPEELATVRKLVKT